MKKRMIWLALLVAVALCGCSKETYEVLGNVDIELKDITPAQIQLNVPEGDTLTVIKGDDGMLYLGEDYEISLQTLSSGNLDQTLQTVTGYSKENITVMEIAEDDVDRYVCAWSAVSEEGELVGRCTVLDDGRFHYCLTVLIKADKAGEVRDAVDAMFAAYSLSSY